MAEVVGERRVKFEARRDGPLPPALEEAAAALAAGLVAMEGADCCPVLDDGKSAGNGALRLEDGTLLVSPSGRLPGVVDPGAIVQLLSFDPATWTARFRSRDAAVQPTSDSPLHWAALVQAPESLGWSARPGAALHGHVFDTDRAAELLELPISAEETMFSTPPDRDALLELLSRAPYPRYPTVVRRGHGFFTLAPDVPEATRLVLDLAARARSLGLLPA